MSSNELFERAVTGAPSEFMESNGATYEAMSPEARAAIDTWLQRVLPRVEFEVIDVDTEDDEPADLDLLDEGNDDASDYDDYEEEEDDGEDRTQSFDGKSYTRDELRDAFARQYRIHSEDEYYRRVHGVDPSWVHEDEQEDDEFGAGFADESSVETPYVQEYDFGSVPDMVYSPVLDRELTYAELVAQFDGIAPEDRLYDDMYAWLEFDLGIRINY